MVLEGNGALGLSHGTSDDQGRPGDVVTVNFATESPGLVFSGSQSSSPDLI
jgi:hypothetical protein